MPDLDRITLVIESLPGNRAQVSTNIHTPTPGMRLETPAHALAIDALGWLGKQECVAGFVYTPALQTSKSCCNQNCRQGRDCPARNGGAA